ncbi:MAG: mycofactocin-coupled SDR family oxidoreductase [Acidimicrobiia bacterium]
MAGRLEGKVALITGAARGQGQAEAALLASEGADIIAVDVCGDLPDVIYPLGSAEDMAETVRMVESHDRRIITVACDVRDRAKLSAGIDHGVAELGRLDIVVANAGITMADRWNDITPEHWETTIGICLTGVWNTAQLAAPHIITGGRGGSMIFISSASGLKGYPGIMAYSTAKHGVVGLMRCFAQELAEHAIRVNSVHPTGVETQIGGEPIHKLFTILESNPKLGAVYINMLDVERLQVDDIANAVLFLASDDSKYITGVTLPVDAGNALI